MSVDNGQFEAGRSLGFNYFQTMRYIIIPQVFKAVLPTLCNEFIALLKETSIIGWIGATVGTITFDLNAASNTIYRILPNYLASGIIVGCCYLIIVYAMTLLIKYLERRLAKSER